MSIIKVENLSKKYLISHESQERYTAMRDVVANKVKKIFSFPKSLQVPKSTKEEFYALRDINFEIEQGDRVGIIGRNGAGKSTLLKVLSRITEPSTGRITIRGRVASLLEVGTGFHPELSGRENIYLNGAILGMSRAEIKRKFDEIVEFAEVEKFLDTPVKRYSSGMYVRLAFSVAAHLEPEILIVDEVLAVGDAQFQKKCLGKMEDVSKNEGRTVIFVSHNMGAITNLCNKGILLNKGSITSIGSVLNCIKDNLTNKNGIDAKIWENSIPGEKKIYFKKIVLDRNEEQNGIVLDLNFTLAAGSEHLKSLIAVDIKNSLGVVIMQAIPAQIPFISIQYGNTNTYLCKIYLNGLIPDFYSISTWIGPHNDLTYDNLNDVLHFEVIQSPVPNRTYPHTLEHGNIIPKSEITLISEC
ncbi:MAG: ATP-binding cassette domain-containing protein [Saprospiraceae bacterium]|nr:ATP-binding cassette domain-containing protein [Saprospiraceae bacterium]